MLTVLMTELIYMNEQSCPCNDDDTQAYECVDAADIKNGEEYQQAKQAPAQIPDVLCLQTFELNWFVNSFIDSIYTCCHN